MSDNQTVIALAGNPNVGKSTIFNGLTGKRQHTGNWTGKTVALAWGSFTVQEREYILVDLPGTYSLDAHSEEEKIARDFVCSGEAEMVVTICDATCLERGLRLLKQILELTYIQTHQIPVLLCVNLSDEAEKNGIQIDFDTLETKLGIPVIKSCAHDKESLDNIKLRMIEEEKKARAEKALSIQELSLNPKKLAEEVVTYHNKEYYKKTEQIDKIITGRWTGGILMFILLMAVFWLSMTGANYPSKVLWKIFFSFEENLADWFHKAGTPEWCTGALVFGMYRVVAWVVSVMLPPMAIFFPLFTILEDFGYLPRVAFNMDRSFEKCHTCGKQCLSMCMGLGCNAAGVVGCRIIDSPRERLIAILTNSMIPCNGRLPTLFTMITLFFITIPVNTTGKSVAAAICLTLVLTVGVMMTLLTSWILSHTLLKGIPSSFTLELPPYRKPQIKKVIIRSVFDRTLFVLGRAVAVAAPTGLLIWFLANANVTEGRSLLLTVTALLEPAGRFLGLDGVVIAAFILGFPANEIVLPIILMAYLQTGTLVEMQDMGALKNILISHGWTLQTAFCMMIFCLFHWPCSTTCLTIHKETGSWKWTAAAFMIPTAEGILLCSLAVFASRVFFTING